MAATNKKSNKLKEPVRVRTKKLADGSESYYLDIYVNGKRSYEFLKMYHLAEVNAWVSNVLRASPSNPITSHSSSLFAISRKNSASGMMSS